MNLGKVEIWETSLDRIVTLREGAKGVLRPRHTGRKTWSVIETALPRLFELRSFSLVGIALVPPKR